MRYDHEVKIVHITRQFLDVSFGGVEQHIYSIALEQSKLGHEVKVIRIGSKPQGNYNSSKFHFKFVQFGRALEQVHDSQATYGIFSELLNRLQSNMYSKSQYENLLVEIGTADAVHFHDFLGVVRVSRKLSGLYSLYWTNHLGEFLMLSRLVVGSVITKFATRQFKFAIGPSRELANSKKMGCPVKYIPNGCQESLPIDSTRDESLDLRKQFNLTNESIFLVPRRWAPTKGIKQLSEALKLLDLQGKAFFVFIGRGEGNYGKYRESVSKDLTECKTSYAVLERVSPEEMLRYYKMSDFTVIPSLEEATSLAALEAMAMSSLVLATPIGGLCEIVKDGETGLLARDTSSEAISELLLRALKMNTWEREEIQQNALRNVNKNYLWTNITKQVMEIYERQ